jgi:hypothetical protein
VSQRARGDVVDSIFSDAVPTLLAEGDRKTLVLLREVIAEKYDPYSYLEIGSYLGGSLQPHLLDARCSAVFSIDLRPKLSADIRSAAGLNYKQNTVEAMRRLLAEAHGGAILGKLRTFDSDASDVPVSEIAERPRLCLIDGEHTDAAVLRDFRACLRFADRPCVIAFDDADLIYGGLGACLRLLRDEGIEHRVYVLPEKIAVIEIGLPVHTDPRVVDLLATVDTYFHAMTTMTAWRSRALKYDRVWDATRKFVPGSRYVSRVLRRLHRAVTQRRSP